MKQLKVLWLAVGVLGISIISASAWVGGGYGVGNGGGGRGGHIAGPRRNAVPVSVSNQMRGLTWNGQFQTPQPFVDSRLLAWPPNRFGCNWGNDWNGRNCNGRNWNGRSGRNNRNCGNWDNGCQVIWGGGGYYGYDNPYPPGYRLDYSVNTPSPQSSSPYNIALNDGVNISPLDPGYNGSGAAATAPQAMSTDGDMVVAVQRELRRRGFYGGAVNGVSDLTTRTAIRSYEASAGLPVTGKIGIMLLKSLGFI